MFSVQGFRVQEEQRQGSGKTNDGERRRKTQGRVMDRGGEGKTYLDVEDLRVYQHLCRLHIEICDLSHDWPAEERYELGSQIRRSSNSAPAQLAEKHDDRHVRNKIEGVNRSRGEAGETIHHLYVAKLKGYVEHEVYDVYREQYKECIRMLNGLEKALERHIPRTDRRWIARETSVRYGDTSELLSPGWPDAEDSVQCSGIRSSGEAGKDGVQSSGKGTRRARKERRTRKKPGT